MLEELTNGDFIDHGETESAEFFNQYCNPTVIAEYRSLEQKVEKLDIASIGEFDGTLCKFGSLGGLLLLDFF